MHPAPFSGDAEDGMQAHSGKSWTVRVAVAALAIVSGAAIFAGCGNGGGTVDGGTNWWTSILRSRQLPASTFNRTTRTAECVAWHARQVTSARKANARQPAVVEPSYAARQCCSCTSSDPANCGGCNTTCASGQVCSSGSCGTTCATGQSLCGGDSGAPYCASTKTDNANCGGCGVTCGNAASSSAKTGQSE